MPGTPTPNLGLTVPTVGGDNNIWGGELNSDLATIDGLALTAFLNVAANFNANPSAVSPWMTYRVTTGVGAISGLLPSAASCPGKVITVKKVDSGTGTVTVTGSIDGQASYILSGQFQYVTLLSNGVTFDVIANN
jgi:hypothetical protein